MRFITVIKYFLYLCLAVTTREAFAQYASGACSLIPSSQTCVDSTPCKTDSSGIAVCLAGVPLPTGGVSTSETCWQYSYQYACASPTGSVNTCSSYQTNSSCSVLSSVCEDTTASTGTCDEWQYTYQCQTQAAVTQPQTVCGDSMINTTAMPTPSNPNNSFSQAAVAQELLNEGATYSSGGFLFGGVQESCTKGYGGIKNCCKSTPGGKTNSAVSGIAFGAAASVVKYEGSVAVDWASPYVYDAMYNSGIWTSGMVQSFLDTGGANFGTSLAASGFSVGAYGFTYSTVAATSGSGFMGGTTTLFGNADAGFLEFNPYVFAAMVVIAVIEDLTSCTSAEQLLALHKGSGLSTYINENCSNSFLGACLEYTDNYCSFNSVLAEIINIQGKKQLGLSIASCQGITPAQLSQINFSQINFGAFTQSILQNAQNNVPTSTSISGAYTPILQNKTQGSAQSTDSLMLPTYPTTSP